MFAIPLAYSAGPGAGAPLVITEQFATEADAREALSVYVGLPADSDIVTEMLRIVTSPASARPLP